MPPTMLTKLESHPIFKIPVKKHHDHGHKRESDSQNAEDLAARSGVQHGAAHGTDGVFAHDGVLNEADGHAERSHAKTPVESSLAPHPAGDQWTEERADVDAHVEDGVAAVAGRESPSS